MHRRDLAPPKVCIMRWHEVKGHELHANWLQHASNAQQVMLIALIKQPNSDAIDHTVYAHTINQSSSMIGYTISILALVSECYEAFDSRRAPHCFSFV